MSYLNKLKAQHAEAVARCEAITELAVEQDREITPEEQKQIDENMELAKSLEPKMEQAREIENRIARNLGERQAGSGLPFVSPKNHAAPKAHGTLKAFKNAQDAYDCGQQMRANFLKDAKAIQYCRDKGFILNVTTEGVNSAAAVLVPEVMESVIIDLKEERGVARRNAYVYPMSSDSATVPRRQSGTTVYYPGEAREITASDMSFSQIRLEAKKAAILSLMSTEVAEDAIVSIADLIAADMAYQFADAEDKAVFLGDGSSTYGGIKGLTNSLLAGSKVTSASGDNTFAELEWAFFEEAVAKLPRFPGMNPAWYVHSSMFYLAMARLSNAAGGNTKADVANGYSMMFMGLPVNFVQVLPSGSGDLAGSVVGFLGDLSMAGTFGSRRGITLSTTTERYWEYDQIGIKATQRYCWNGHETGTASAAGPMIGLVMNT